MQKFTGQNGTDSTGKNESTVKRCISSERNSRFKFHIFFFPAGTIPLYVSHIQGTIEKSLSSIVWQQRPFSERGWCHSLSQMIVGRLKVLRYQNIFITDICNFMNHMISLFCGRGDTVQKTVGQNQIKTPAMLCGALYQDLGSLESSPWVTPGTISYRMGLRTPGFLLSCSY